MDEITKEVNDFLDEIEKRRGLKMSKKERSENFKELVAIKHILGGLPDIEKVLYTYLKVPNE